MTTLECERMVPCWVGLSSVGEAPLCLYGPDEWETCEGCNSDGTRTPEVEDASD